MNVHEVKISHQAGAVPFRRGSEGELEILLITSKSGNRWIFPKGNITRRFSPAECAEKEALEEAGITGVVFDCCIGAYNVKKSKKQWIIHLFPMEVRHQLDHWPEENLRNREWVGFETAKKRFDNPELQKILERLQTFTIGSRASNSNARLSDTEYCPTIFEIRKAAERIGPFIHRTPTLTCQRLNRMTGARLYFKCENFQKVGAFKFRGAVNAVFSLPDDEAKRGVATHSSGNHAAALALAARLRGIKAYIVMPSNAPQIKKNAVHEYGAEITYCEPTLASREETLERVIEATGATFVHPYNDYRVIAGQGTAALELLDEARDLDLVLVPVGGGGLLSGTAITVTESSPQTLVIAAEPEGADDAYRSMKEGRLIPSVNPQTIADGLLTSLGDLTFPIIRERVSRIVTVSDPGIILAMRHIWERMKIIIEPSAAVPFAALLENKIDAAGKRVGIILTGGNLDLEHLPWAVK